MNCRALTWGMLLALSALLIVGSRGSGSSLGSYTDDGGKTGRFKTVEIQTTQYIWEMVSNRDGRVICQIIANHPNRPTNEEAIQACADQIFPPEPTPAPAGTPASTPQPLPTQPPFNLADFFNSVYWRFVNTQTLTRTVQVPLPEMIVNLTVPPGQTQPFYAIIAGYEPIFGQRITGISGILNGIQFICPSARCSVPIQTSSNLEFWATSSFGDDSQHMQAALVINQEENKTSLEIASLVPATLFQDACGIAWGLAQTNRPAWATFPITPDELNTLKPYQYLTGKLLSSGLANAADCPGGGLLSSGAPNTCGLEKATQATIDWQNQYDVDIWESGRELGIPPRMIKTLFGQESQFWPGNSRNIFSEYGLGQINQSGADVALRWDNDLFNTICSGLIYDCSKVYGRLPEGMQAMMRGGLIRAIDSDCSSCPHSIDLARAYDSVPTLTRTLRSNCLQTNYLARKYTATTSYEDLWRFTLVSFHSGYQCLKEAFDGVEINRQPYDWDHVSAYLSCPGSQLYVSDFWKSLLSFDQYLLKIPEAKRPSSLATFTFAPKPTLPAPTSTPTPILSLGHVRVLVYVDSNKNNYAEDQEKVNGIKVTATFSDGQILTGVTINGEVVFDLSGRPIDSSVVIALPDLFRSQKVRVLRDGEIPVIFRLEQPVVPPALP